MATIKQLPTLNNPNGTEDLVVQNDTANYKMAYKPPIYDRYDDIPAGTAAEVINAILNAYRTEHGDMVNYEVHLSAGVFNWPNGCYLTFTTFQLGNYCVLTGIMISQTTGVYAFQRWDTIGGNAGTLRVSELGSAIA